MVRRLVPEIKGKTQGFPFTPTQLLDSIKVAVEVDVVDVVIAEVVVSVVVVEVVVPVVVVVEDAVVVSGVHVCISQYSQSSNSPLSLREVAHHFLPR